MILMSSNKIWYASTNELSDDLRQSLIINSAWCRTTEPGSAWSAQPPSGKLPFLIVVVVVASQGACTRVPTSVPESTLLIHLHSREFPPLEHALLRPPS